ncbi:MAG: 40S ribosomal protein S3a/S1 [Candidatus Aenigmatarchaeota archaeon]
MAKKSKAEQWYTIVAPKMFGEVEFGQTVAADPKTLVGRKISASLMELVNDFHKYYMKFSFKVTKVDGTRALTEFAGSECMQDYVSRMVTRWARRVDTVQDLITKDGVQIRVKGIAIIPRRVKSSVKAAVRDEVRRTVKEEITESTLEDVLKGVISDSIKKHVLRNAQKVYPMRSFEIRKIDILPQTAEEKKDTKAE